MFDLDNFKLANDVFGHAYGDAMITENAGKLKKFFRERDITVSYTHLDVYKRQISNQRSKRGFNIMRKACH